MLSVPVFLVALIGAASAAGNWGYSETHDGVYGPADWGHVSKYCDGRAQTPVDINTRFIKESDRHELHVHFLYGGGYTKGNLHNNGHSPTFTVTRGGARMYNPINGQRYQLAQFHFHFGCDDSVGSEHTVNGKAYPGELHLVFFNTKYGSIGSAATEPDGLTVIGIFLTKGRTGAVLAKLANQIGSIGNEGSTISNVYVAMEYLVPGLSDESRGPSLDFYSYKGSLTTPGCYESVSWLVLKEPIEADDQVLKYFRRLRARYGKNGGMMCDNYRPIQALNGRTIILNSD